MLSAAQVALLGALSAPFALAFSPVFTNPRQCESMRITWSELDLPVVDMPLTEIFMSLIPLDNDPSRMAPQPYSLSVPAGGHEIAALPFPAGTKFFASAQMFESSGFTRRTVSEVFTVEHSSNSGCLPAKTMPTDGRAKAKSFGKRQVSVVGPSLVTATGVPAPVNAIANPSSTSSSSAPAASGSSGSTPPIRVIGSSNIPASGAPEAPANAAPAPSSSAPVPPIRVIGTSVISATGDSEPPASSSDASDAGAYNPSPTSTDSDSLYTETTTSTSCTETPTELPMESETSMEMPPSTVTVPSNENDGYYVPSNENDGYYSGTDEEEPCEETMDPSEHESMHIMPMPTETITTLPALPAATITNTNTDTEVVHYTALDDMVNAANGMFKAWNPYKAAYTPSAGN